MSDAPDPDLVFSTLSAYQKTQALKGAIELNLFTFIARGDKDSKSLAKSVEGSERAVRILCDFLTINGFLTKSDESEYQLTPTSEVFLNQDSPNYMGSVTRFMNSEHLLSAFEDVASLVRNGQTGLDGDGTVEPDWEGWVEFARSMTPMMGPAADQIATLALERKPGPIKVLDIAAGHGLFGISIAKTNPAAQITALDWEKVLVVAQENAELFGVQDQLQFLSGDAKEIDYGEDFDVVLLTNFIHHFDAEECIHILKKVKQCLKLDGIAINLEFVPNEDRISPPSPAAFSFVMLGTTRAGDAYTFDELKNFSEAAGFSKNEIIALEKSVQSVVISQT